MSGPTIESASMHVLVGLAQDQDAELCGVCDQLGIDPAFRNRVIEQVRGLLITLQAAKVPATESRRDGE